MDGRRSVSQSSRQQDTEKTAASTPSKGRQPKPDKQPAADQMPGGISASVAPHCQVLSRPIGKTGVRGVPGGVLVTFSPRKKGPGVRGRGGPVGDKTAPRAVVGPFGKPRDPGVKPPLKKQTAPLPHKETKALTSSAVPLFLPRLAGPLKAVM